MTETRTYTIPLRRDFVSKPKYKRAKRAIKTIKNFASKHMKVESEDVKVSSGLNEVVWQNGARNPPGKVTVLMQQKGSLLHVVHKDEKDYLESLDTTKEKNTPEPQKTEESTQEETEAEEKTEEESSEDEEAVEVEKETDKSQDVDEVEEQDTESEEDTDSEEKESEKEEK